MSHAPTLDDLRSLNEQIESLLTAPRPVWVGGLACVGLHLDDSPAVYGDTPTNCAPFAYTGGDGCHFSLLQTESVDSSDSPVVLTVPCSPANLIVGSNLWEFLSLGCHRGYFGLEQLAYKKAKALR